MTKMQSFYAKVTKFFESYLTIPKNTFFYEQDESLTGRGIKYCANYLISNGVFLNANDMKTQAFKVFISYYPIGFLKMKQGVIPNDR